MLKTAILNFLRFVLNIAVYILQKTIKIVGFGAQIGKFGQLRLQLQPGDLRLLFSKTRSQTQRNGAGAGANVLDTFTFFDFADHG